jgi:hypothetical protein
MHHLRYYGCARSRPSATTAKQRVPCSRPPATLQPSCDTRRRRNNRRLHARGESQADFHLLHLRFNVAVNSVTPSSKTSLDYSCPSLSVPQRCLPLRHPAAAASAHLPTCQPAHRRWSRQTHHYLRALQQSACRQCCFLKPMTAGM